MKRVSKIIFTFLLFSLLLIFSSCTEHKSNNSNKREYDIIDGKIYIDLFENQEEFIKNGLKEINKNPYSQIVVTTGVSMYIYLDYSKMDDYMKAIHRCNLKYSYSNEEEKIKDDYYHCLNSYIYDSFNYDFYINDCSVDKTNTVHTKYKDKPIIYLAYGNSTLSDPLLSKTGMDYFYSDYEKIKEISLYDYVIKIEVIEGCEIGYFE